jgi:hypothetical protein
MLTACIGTEHKVNPIGSPYLADSDSVMLRIIPSGRLTILPTHLIQAPRSPSVKFAFIGKSVLRRRKIRRLDIDSPEDPLPLFEQMSKEPIRAKPGARKKGLPKDSPEIRNSKTVSWVLRHGATAEGIAMRPDGYVKVTDLVSFLDSLQFCRERNSGSRSSRVTD